MSGTGWTIDELAQRAADALAGVQVPNGRVTAAPDRRVIRWYATIGLLDRPLRNHGRTAWYGPRHLLQLVAVKRRQAEGRSLAAIQAELAGATDATLHRVAGLPEQDMPAPAGDAAAQLDGTGSLPDSASNRSGFWREVPATGAPAGTVAPVYPVPLHPDATLTLAAAPGPDDLAAIHAAAAPLLDLLAARGLLPTGRTA